MDGSLELGQLKKIASYVRKEHEAIVKAACGMLEHARKAGEGLLEAKEMVGHGGWEDWLDNNFPASKRTAVDYMRIAKRWDELEAIPQSTADLERLSIANAVKLLAKPKESEPEPSPEPEDDPAPEPALPLADRVQAAVERAAEEEARRHADEQPEEGAGVAGRYRDPGAQAHEIEPSGAAGADSDPARDTGRPTFLADYEEIDPTIKQRLTVAPDALASLRDDTAGAWAELAMSGQYHPAAVESAWEAAYECWKARGKRKGERNGSSEAR